MYGERMKLTVEITVGLPDAYLSMLDMLNEPAIHENVA